MPASDKNVRYITAPNILVRHAFTTRRGGASGGIFESLNLAQNRGDDEDKVRENYRIICGELGILQESLVFSRQIHENTVKTVTRKDAGRLFESVPYECDGLVTADQDAALIIFIADCVPVLLHDPQKGVIAAVHAGWRGTVKNICGVAAEKMAAEFGCDPRDIRAAIGPSISACCYETDAEVPDALFKALGDGASSCVTSHGEKYMVDLKRANRLLLKKAGLTEENIFVSGDCTMCKSDVYWSHRATRGQRGSQAAIITLKGLLQH